MKHLVERHEGKIWVESELGKGSAFIFEVPLLPSQAVEEMKQLEAAAKEPRSARPASNATQN